MVDTGEEAKAIFNLPVISVEDRDEEFNGQIMNNFASDHYSPSVRAIYITKPNDSTSGFGFHLSRSKWDPYPYISRVDKDSFASTSGLREGDCVLEVNGEDVLGMRIVDVANMVKSKNDIVSLLLWNTNIDQACESNLCCGPMPINYEKLAATVQTILTAIECPVCFNTIPSPFTQCQNGHLLCLKCRSRSDRCPICRDRYSVVRCLLAEQIYTTLLDVFDLKDGPQGKIRERIFGVKACKPEEKQKDDMNVTLNKPNSHTQKFLAKIMGKSSSMVNLNTKKDLKRIDEEGNISKNKMMSQSSSDIFHFEPAIKRCPSMNRYLGSELSTSCGSLLSSRRPRSCHVSTESLPTYLQRTSNEETHFYSCPSGHECFHEKLASAILIQHINEVHQHPVISFGSSSVEISLPPRAPIENASLILLLDEKQFWVKVVVADSNNDLFISCLMQAPFDYISKYVLEVAIRKSDGSKVPGVELINRNEIYCLETTSWREIFEAKKGIKLNSDNIQSTFANADINLKASIKRIEDI
ncbi:CLUMA_CG002400, isoform A [Clunio marinus]|uniref:CLUMA_CG002400, isoform A n=1 Tax=Clunio marinus TaxID=568069 RepID=A0A1J1HQE6_9DIPT|nr:CLUMA_CG002400, isoform A [Clunio marinus]